MAKNEGFKDFINDCKRELDQHEKRCITDPDYCLGYVQSYEDQIGIHISDKRFDELNKSDIQTLISKLECVLSTKNMDDCLHKTIKQLIKHLKAKMDAMAFIAAIGCLSEKCPATF